MRAHMELVYASVGDRPLHLDLYLPNEARRPLPLIVWVHGGAWRMGSRADPIALRLVPEGYAVAAIEYRFSQEAVFPAQIHDCKAAVRWLRASAEPYGLDPNRIGAWGASAGGHLVALLGTASAAAELEGDLGNPDESSAVQAVCDWFGPSNFLHMDDVPGSQEHNAPDSPESQLLGAPIQTRPDLVARANPITYITPDTPPFQIMHGTDDDVVIPGQSELLHAALLEAGVTSTLIMLGRLRHGFGGEADRARWGEIYGYVTAFFGTHLLTEVP